MKKSDFYFKSARLGVLVDLSKGLLSYHLARYKHFVDGSDKGENCKYALVTKKTHCDENELVSIVSHLKKMRSCIDLLIEEYEND